MDNKTILNKIKERQEEYIDSEKNMNACRHFIEDLLFMYAKNNFIGKIFQRDKITIRIENIDEVTSSYSMLFRIKLSGKIIIQDKDNALTEYIAKNDSAMFYINLDGTLMDTLEISENDFEKLCILADLAKDKNGINIMYGLNVLFKQNENDKVMAGKVIEYHKDTNVFGIMYNNVIYKCKQSDIQVVIN